MENMVDNHVRIYAINEEVLNKAILVAKSKINCAAACPPGYDTTTEVSFSKNTQLFIYRMSFCTFWSPPIKAYEDLIAIEGVTVDAFWFDEVNHFDVCYHWPADVQDYKPRETDLNEQGVEVWNYH